MNSTHQLCLVSAQPTPNLTPLLDHRLKPEQVTLLVSPDMQQRADDMQAVLQPAGIKVRQHHIDDAWDIEHIQNRILSLLEDVDGSMVLNATGGTKPMSIAAYEVFRDLDWPIFYVHVEKGRVVWMHPKEQASINLENRIRLKQFLLAHGVEMQALQALTVPKAWKQLTADLIANMDSFASALSTVNYMAVQAGSSHLKTNIPKGKEHWAALQHVLQMFEGAGVLHCDKQQVVFPDEASRFFVNGGWLEHHVFAVVQKLRKQHPRIHDVGQGVVVRRGGVPNELDVVFLCDNHLYVIECKTKQFKAEGAEALYKLDSLAPSLGGLRAKSMLVSFQKLGVEHQKRAKKDGVCLCVGQQLQQLEQHILRWIG